MDSASPIADCGSSRFRRRGRHQRGSVSLEMALLLPILLVLVVGLATVGHALIVRFLLSSAAYDAARKCTLRGTPTLGCANKNTKAKLGPALLKWCKSFQVQTPSQANRACATPVCSWPVRTFEVRVGCDYAGIMSRQFLTQNKITIATLRARAAMPY